jgi:hypothetical protein
LNPQNLSISKKAKEFQTCLWRPAKMWPTLSNSFQKRKDSLHHDTSCSLGGWMSHSFFLFCFFFCSVINWKTKQNMLFH